MRAATAVQDPASTHNDEVRSRTDWRWDQREWIRVVERYQEELSFVDAELQKIVKEHIDERKAKEAPLIAVLPHLVAEAFGIHDKKYIFGIAGLALRIDHFCHLIDDCTDLIREDKMYVARLHLASAVLANIGSAINAVADDVLAANRAWERYLSDASEAERYLLRHHGSRVEYTDRDFMMMARRAGLVKMIVWISAEKAGNGELLTSMEDALDNVAVGVQILDELLDWEEDYREQIYTWPICLALAGRNTSSGQRPTALVLQELIFGGSIVEKVLSVAQVYFERGRRSLDLIGCTTGSSVLYEASRSVEEARLVISRPMADRDGVGARREALVRRMLQPRLQDH